MEEKSKKELRREYDQKRYQEKKDEIRLFQKMTNGMPIKCECGLTVSKINYEKHLSKSRHTLHLKRKEYQDNFTNSVLNNYDDIKKQLNLW
jgi:hypothetical protein